jgi:hypothetical protein
MNGERSKMKLTRVGVDLAKNIFQLHGVDRAERPVWCKRLKRNRWIEEIEQNVEPGVEIGMEACGGAPVRFGNKPKALALYRAAQPAMRKRQTSVFKRGQLKGKVELLAKGQQFVAYAIHPDTKQPYEWHGGDPLTVRADSLPVLTAEQVSEIIKQCAARLAQWADGPAPAAPASREQLDAALFPGRGVVATENDALIIQPQRATRAQLLRALADLAEYDQGDYDSWREVGQIIHHETRGSDEGLEIFIKYSRCLAGFYAGAEAGEEGCRAKWRSFGRSGAKPLTFGTLMHRIQMRRLSSLARRPHASANPRH